MLRHADPTRDAAACAAIYAPYVAGTAVSFEATPPSAEDFGERIERTSRAYPWLVLEHDGVVVGFAYASRHHERAAYRWAVDVAIYVDGSHQARGAGRRLCEALLELLARQGLRIACAGIALPNDASIALHRALGFEHVETYRAIGWKAGAWHDVSWWQKQLSSDDAGDGPPGEPLGPQRLP